nr:MAG TPA: hypothetical protein [Caudoviricetes sp.]
MLLFFKFYCNSLNISNRLVFFPNYRGSRKQYIVHL